MKRPRAEEDLDALLELMSAAQHHGPDSTTSTVKKMKKKVKDHPPSASSTSGKKKLKSSHKAGSHGSQKDDGPGRALAGSGEEEEEEEEGGEREEEDDDDDSTYQVANGGAMSLVWRQDVKPPAAAASSSRSSGSRRPPPPPLLAVEVQRHDLVASLSVLFLNAIKSMNLDMKVVSFERWLLVQQQKAVTTSAADPLLPDLGGKKEPDRLLVAELLEAGASKKEAKRLSNYLAKSSTKAVRQLQRQFPVGAMAGGNKGSKITLHDEGDGSYSVRWRSTSFKVNRGHYDKLRMLYQRHGGGGREGSNPGGFLEHVFLVLARYDALAGGTDRGGGFQGALNNACFDILLNRFDCRMECFASPLNCRYGRFCSAFPDTDVVFGSIGSFFDFHPAEGCFEANPPFVPYMMEKMSSHMQTLLVDAKSHGRALCFIVVIPTWSPDKNTRTIQKASRPSWESLRNSPFCVEHLVLKANEHGYCEGSQHRLPTRYKSSRFDTSVFFLQTPAARTKWRVTKEACEELREAFASRHEEETRLRKAGETGLMPGPLAAGERVPEKRKKVVVGKKKS